MMQKKIYNIDTCLGKWKEEKLVYLKGNIWAGQMFKFVESIGALLKSFF
jgi:hypothetical protein